MPRVATCVLAGLALALAALVPASPAEEKGKAVTPFNGTDLKGWKPRNEKNNKWVVGFAALDEKEPRQFTTTVLKPGQEGGPRTHELINDLKKGEHGTDLYTDEKFGDCLVELELMVPKGSNSGVYLMGEYEVQVLDSYGKEKVGPGDMGGIYNTAAPKKNACKKPGEWQKFVIDFQAPRFADGKKTSNALFRKVTLNDEVIHEMVEAPKPTGSELSAKEVATGPLMIQGDHGPVAVRNIKITPKGK
jgi:3-keto-disaccharide hydrolase